MIFNRPIQGKDRNDNINFRKSRSLIGSPSETVGEHLFKEVNFAEDFFMDMVMLLRRSDVDVHHSSTQGITECDPACG